MKSQHSHSVLTTKLSTIFNPLCIFNATIVFMLAFAFFTLSSCQKDDDSGSTTKNAKVEIRTACTTPTPTLGTGPGGNGNCPAGYAFTSGKFDIDQDLPYPQSGHLGDPAPHGIDWTISADGTEVSWSGEYVCGLSAVVKGGPASYIYTYGAGCNSDVSLVSPLNGGGNVPMISNLTFCWNECVPLVCEDETAFGGNYAGTGSAWWFYYDTEGDACQDIFARQHYLAGEVCRVDNEFTITLFGDWALDPDTNEPVKAQGYTTLPSKRPSAGLFTLYKGTDLSFTGNDSRYYVIHLDLTICE